MELLQQLMTHIEKLEVDVAAQTSWSGPYRHREMTWCDDYGSASQRSLVVYRRFGKESHYSRGCAAPLSHALPQERSNPSCTWPSKRGSPKATIVVTNTTYVLPVSPAAAYSILTSFSKHPVSYILDLELQSPCCEKMCGSV